MDNFESEVKDINSNVNTEINNGLYEEKEITNLNVLDTKEKDNLITKLKNKKGFWGVLGAVLLILIKFKSAIIFILVKFKFIFIFLKLGKFISTIASMLLMIVIYAKTYGWTFASGFVLLLFIHEMGHYLTAKAIKLDVGVPIFIPFVGALISLKEEPKDAVTEAKVAMGGPLVGSLGSLICLLLYYILKEDVLMALAYTGFMLNLFNLIPVHPLDGGRVVSAISPRLWLIGIPIGVIALFKAFNPIILILLALGIVKVIEQYRNPDKLYYEVKTTTRWMFALGYFGLILLLGLGITYIHGIHSSILIQ